jgi:mono/diheme cytochrome c family protein
MSRAILFGTVLLAFASQFIAGCERAPDVEYKSSDQVAELKSELKAQIGAILEKECGTVQRPILLGEENVDTAHLLFGRDVYQQRCMQCHGATGDGQGPAAKWLNPAPRDYRPGKFKFSSTPYENRPLRSDLVRTLRSGIPGTSMPAFNLLPSKEIDAVIDYVLVLTRRGELEFQLASEAASAEELPDDVVSDLKNLVIERWTNAQTQQTYPLTPPPKFTAEHVAAGKKDFLTRGCSKCHGEDGRGQTPDNLRGNLKDAWGHATKAADLTSGLLRGGRRPEDVYRRIYNGITGTPMPSFQAALSAEPATFWNLVSYVLYVSNRRRAGEIPEAGLMELSGETSRPDTSVPSQVE